MEVLSIYISLFSVWFNMVQHDFKIDHAKEITMLKIVKKKDSYSFKKQPTIE